MRYVAFSLAALFVCARLFAADEAYRGPRPQKPDIPYLLLGDNLVQTEAAEAKEEKGKNDTVYTVAGASSPARTPLAEPIFLFESNQIEPEALQLYRFEVKNGSREVIFSNNRKKSARPFRFTVTRLAERLYRLEVDENLGLENGEYSFSPKDSNTVFCFEVY